MLIVALHIFKQSVQLYAIHAQVGNLHSTLWKLTKTKKSCQRWHFTLKQIVILVDCRWSDWTIGECSVSCGDGVRQNHRFKEREALYGGAPCEGVAAQTEACINRLCPGKNDCKTVNESRFRMV